nr:hypothetical protein [uncultured Pseudodesulfovibrio sp.]
MQHDDMKAQGLMRLLTQGLLAYSEQKTSKELGDRSQYIGMSDIGKGMECMRAAVASKLGMSRTPSTESISKQTPDELAHVLGRQIILQRGHWQEDGIQKALEATGMKLVPQLEICIAHDGVPIKAHLDFTLVWGGMKPAVRVLELKSNERIPASLYSSYEAQLYGQVGLLKTFWNKPCFSVQEKGIEKATFPQAIRALFGVELPESPDPVDIEGWVLSISMSTVKPFGPYLAEITMLDLCLQTAVAIWRTAEDVRAGNLALNDLDYCRGFHPLCDWCDVNADCPKFQGLDISELDSASCLELEELALLKDKRDHLTERIAETEQRIKRTYRLANLNDENPWLIAGNNRFRVAMVAGRKTLDRNQMVETLNMVTSDSLKAQKLLGQCEKTGNDYERLYVGKINKPLKSAA